MHVVAVAPKLYKACREKLEMIEHKEKELEKERSELEMGHYIGRMGVG